jgi:hypothetical protein
MLAAVAVQSVFHLQIVLSRGARSVQHRHVVIEALLVRAGMGTSSLAAGGSRIVL